MGDSSAKRGGSLLRWEVTSEELVQPAGATVAAAAPPPPLSLVDRLAAPLAYMHQSLVFESPLDAGKLRDALARALALFPTLSCRAAHDKDGEWELCQPGAGALLTLGTSAAPLRLPHLSPPLPAAALLTDLGGALFGHLESASLATERLPLVEVALVTLDPPSSSDDSKEGGSSIGGGGESSCSRPAGYVLGLRVSHLVADFGTLRALLHHLAAFYSGRTPQGGPPQPVEPLVSALAAAPPPAGTLCWNYLPQPPEFLPQLMSLVAAPRQAGLTLHFSPARLAALKARAAAEAAAAAGGGESAGGDGQAWVSTNDALMAWLWKAFAGLPCRRGAVTAFNQGLDMRGRLEAQGTQGDGQEQQQQQARWLYGNVATSAFTPDLDVSALSLGQVALALRRTVACDAAKFASDMAHMGAAVAGGARCGSFAILPVLRIVEAAAAGRPAPVMVSMCSLDYAADADFGGQLPVASVPTFGRMVIPIAHSQPAVGGGVCLHFWLPEEQARELAAAAEQAAA